MGAERQFAKSTTTKLRYTYDSLTTPRASPTRWIRRTGERKTVLKRTPAPTYDPAQYVTERVWATARDGTKIPVSLVYRKGFKRDGSCGDAAICLRQLWLCRWTLHWSPTIVSLLDRGMVYAIAHIRGGQEMGRAWYDHGHLLNKKNTFTDFIDVTRYPRSARLCGEGPRRRASAAAPAAC